MFSPKSEADVDSIHAYIFVENPEAADRVLEAIGESFELLARNPEIAALRKFPSGAVRFWPVREFPNYLVSIANFQTEQEWKLFTCSTARVI